MTIVGSQECREPQFPVCVCQCRHMIRHYRRCQQENHFSEHQMFTTNEIVNYALHDYNNIPEIMRSFGNVWVTLLQVDEVIRLISACRCCHRHQTRREIIYHRDHYVQINPLRRRRRAIARVSETMDTDSDASDNSESESSSADEEYQIQE